MKKIIITVANIISSIPILIYPIIFATSGMIFDAPDSGKYILNWIGFFILMLYPLFIITFIIFSRKKNSLLLASVALIPLLFLLFVFFFSAGLSQKDDYNTLNKDFICNSNSFLWLQNGTAHAIDFLEKENFLNYSHINLGFIENGSIKIYSNNISLEKAKDLLSNCKNKESKSLLDIYTLTSKDIN